MRTTVLITLIAAALSFPLAASGEKEPASTDYRQPAALEKLVAAGTAGYVLLDVRTPEEYAEGYIPTAVNLPYDTISADNLPSGEKEGLVIVYCRSGRRSAVAAETLKNLGFTNVVDFGGITRWQGALKR